MALGQSRTVYLRLENGSGHGLTLDPISGDPSLGALFGPSNQDGNFVMSRGRVIALVEGDEQTIKVSQDVYDRALLDNTSDDLGNLIAYTGDYATDLPIAGHDGSYKALRLIASRTVNGRTAVTTVATCKVSVDGKGAADANTWTVSIEGWGITRA
jgi:hypothetical protein